MMRAILPLHAREGIRRLLAVAGLALLAGCASAPAVKHHVLTPPPSAPRDAFFVARPEVQSRETGDAAWARNQQYGEALVEALRAALRARGKALLPPPADTIGAKVYLAYGEAPVKVKHDRRRPRRYVEVRLQLLDGESGTVRYSTHTQVPIAQAGFFDRVLGDAPDPDRVIRDALAAAATDFVSRL